MIRQRKIFASQINTDFRSRLVPTEPWMWAISARGNVANAFPNPVTKHQIRATEEPDLWVAIQVARISACPSSRGYMPATTDRMPPSDSGPGAMIATLIADDLFIQPGHCVCLRPPGVHKVSIPCSTFPTRHRLLLYVSHQLKALAFRSHLHARRLFRRPGPLLFC